MIKRGHLLAASLLLAGGCSAGRGVQGKTSAPAPDASTALYADLLREHRAGEDEARKFFYGLSGADLRRLEEYIRTRKGSSNGLPLDFHLDPNLPANETDAASWFMRMYSSYRPD